MDETLKEEIIAAVKRGRTADEIEQMVVKQRRALREDPEARAALWLFANALQDGSWSKRSPWSSP